MERLYLCVVFLLFAVPSLAQNTGGVFSPVVTEGHRSAQYRLVVDPENSAGETGVAQRFHYQESLNDDLMWRFIGQVRKTPDSDFDFDFVQAELFWDLGGDNQNHRSGFRFDLRIRDGDRPEQFGVNWMNQFSFDNGWGARAVLLTNHQFGDNAADGINLGSRFRLAKSIGEGKTLGIEMFNTYGSTSDLGGFDSQNHALGPIYSAPLFSSDWSVFSGVLFGISEAAADMEFRLWLNKSL